MAPGDGGQLAGSEVREIAPGIWCWQRRPRGLRPGAFGARTSYALTADGETLLVDPLVTSGTMTNRIDRLEQAGLVARRPDPQDKRGVLVRLTAQGTERVDAALADLLTSERAFLHPIPEDSRRALAGLLRDLLAPLDAE